MELLARNLLLDKSERSKKLHKLYLRKGGDSRTMQQLKRDDPLYERIYQSLVESILSGEIALGERMVDTRVAQDYGVSRSPVREAFRKLESNGLLVNKDGMTAVISPTLQDVLEVYQIRMGLESVAAFWAARRMRNEELKTLSLILKETEIALEQNDTSKIIALNTQFHQLIVVSSGNHRLVAMVSKVHLFTRLFRNTTIKKYKRSDSFLLEHYDILQALTIQEPELAAERMEEHIRQDMEHYRKCFLEDGGIIPITTKLEV